MTKIEAQTRPSQRTHTGGKSASKSAPPTSTPTEKSAPTSPSPNLHRPRSKRALIMRSIR
jgi:hypothetical protein